MQLNRTRILFFAIIGLAALVVCVGVALTQLGGVPLNPGAPTAVPAPRATDAPVLQTPQVKPPTPIWGPNYKAGDGKPTFICGLDAFASYLTLIQIQTQGLDVARGFHLGIVPFQLPNKPEYALTEDQSDGFVRTGQWDCVLNTVDSVATGGGGVITAIVDESAGGDGLWARAVPTINDLKGKRIAFVRDSSAEYFVYYTLSVARLNPKFDVRLVPADTPDEAVKLFNDGKADVVSAWEPQLSRAKTGGGTPLLTTSQLRLIVDALIVSKNSIATKPNVVQSFHDAWFDALKQQAENFDASAAAIIKWGNTDWTEVRTPADLRAQLDKIAQADLNGNAFVMRDPAALISRIEIARRVWAGAGVASEPGKPEDLIDPRFVANSSAQPNLKANGQLVNTTFSMSAKPDFSALKVQAADTLAVLPCREFKFLPDSATLTLESRRILDDCVAPTLQQSVGLFLRVTGSSAWPGPKGTYTEAQIKEFAQARAVAVIDYLSAQHKIDKARFIADAALPPPERRETDDAALQEKDRYVEMTLITVGR